MSDDTTKKAPVEAKTPTLEELAKLMDDKFTSIVNDLDERYKKLYENSRQYEQKLSEIANNAETKLIKAPEPTFKSLDPVEFFKSELEEYNSFESVYGMKKKYNLQAPMDNLKFRMMLDLREFKSRNPEVPEDEAMKFIAKEYADEIKSL